MTVVPEIVSVIAASPGVRAGVGVNYSWDLFLNHSTALLNDQIILKFKYYNLVFYISTLKRNITSPSQF